MRAIACPVGGPLSLEEAPVPDPAPGEVLIEVAAAGVNRPDLLQRAGLYPAPPSASPRLGLEVAGMIIKLGAGVGRWAVGDQVVALLNGGGYAEAVTAPAGQVLPWPQGLSAPEACALPEACFTVWANLFEAGALAPGETTLIQGGTSGIGVIAIQMAKAHGARVLATAGGAAKAALCAQLEADRAIDYTAEDFEAVAKAEGGVDVILDMVGGGYAQKHLNVLNERGRLVQIAFLNGSSVQIDLMRLMLKRLTVTGSTLRSRPNEEKARLAREVEGVVWPWVATGKVRPVVDQIFPFADAEAAHQRMISGAHSGKIVLTP